ncbi:hypothetical protein L1987_65503 [Smallanthus sonchifolius]|uniref:Uncharacterized protein n=1 Tax=Smallanthus sonchifolius TaxID=185202 RepID=A0ACB9BUM6_9ASTR|nr:hypothetical protein L1987_65503 [Smallanthus sonchifolius]
MGKASRWIINLLLGKKEDKINNKDRYGDSSDAVILSSPPPATAIIPASPRRRWSFRRSNSKKKVAVNHKSCRSFDSIMSSQLLSQALFDYAIQHQNHTTNTTRRVLSSAIAVTAATTIQAAFRSYLARKALCALRGLVKLQALVRGHSVRKRTATMVRCMSALVAIQIRARFQRIQMVEDAGSTSKQGFLTAHTRHLSAPQLREHFVVNVVILSPSFRDLQDYDDKYGQFGSKANRQASRRFSIDLTHEKSMRLHRTPTDEVAASSQTSTLHEEPNYMTKTESSRAKTRSQSAPRQRPTKQKHEKRRSSSNEGLTAVTRTHQKGHEGLSIKHRSSKSTNDFEFDSASTCTNGSSYYTTLYEYDREVSTYIQHLQSSPSFCT